MLLAVDPGLEGTGWAVFRGKTPTKVGVEIAGRGYQWYEKLHYYTEFIERLCVKVQATEIIFERPMYMQSAGGQVTAKTDSLVKLAMLVGALYVRVPPMIHRRILVTPNQWKGQLPKEVVNDRIAICLGEVKVRKIGMSDPDSRNSHDWDAVGIGLNHLGRF